MLPYSEATTSNAIRAYITPLEEAEEDEDFSFCTEESTWVPIKKRRRLINYSVCPGKRYLDRKIVPVMKFTVEEGAKVGQMLSGQAKHVALESNCAMKTINPEVFHEHEAGRVEAIANGGKIVINENYLQFRYKLGKEVFRKEGYKFFEVFTKLPTHLRNAMFEVTHPSSIVIWFTYLHSRRNAGNLMQQERQVLCSAETAGYRVRNIPDIVNMRSIRLDDFETFTSPWATNVDDEIKFERVVAMIGDITKGNFHINVIFFLMVMCNPNSKRFYAENTKDIPILRTAQLEIDELMYRYLKTQDGYTEDLAASAVRSLKHLVSEVHECAHIFWKKRLQTCLDTTKTGDICVDQSSSYIWREQIQTMENSSL